MRAPRFVGPSQGVPGGKKTRLVHALRFKERIDAEQELMALVAKKKAARAAAEEACRSRPLCSPRWRGRSARRWTQGRTSLRDSYLYFEWHEMKVASRRRHQNGRPTRDSRTRAADAEYVLDSRAQHHVKSSQPCETTTPSRSRPSASVRVRVRVVVGVRVRVGLVVEQLAGSRPPVD